MFSLIYAITSDELWIYGYLSLVSSPIYYYLKSKIQKSSDLDFEYECIK
jgi:hypothetical protein